LTPLGILALTLTASKLGASSYGAFAVYDALKDSIFNLIDAVTCRRIWLDWTCKTVTKDEAKSYVNKEFEYYYHLQKAQHELERSE
jgi:hypothetical protein